MPSDEATDMVDLQLTGLFVEVLSQDQVVHQISILDVLVSPLCDLAIDPEEVLVLLFISPCAGDLQVLAILVFGVQLHFDQLLLVPEDAVSILSNILVLTSF